MKEPRFVGEMIYSYVSVTEEAPRTRMILNDYGDYIPLKFPWVYLLKLTDKTYTSVESLYAFVSPHRIDSVYDKVKVMPLPNINREGCVCFGHIPEGADVVDVFWNSPFRAEGQTMWEGRIDEWKTCPDAVCESDNYFGHVVMADLFRDSTWSVIK